MARYSQDDAVQENETSMEVLQSQFQGIFIKGSTDIAITQLEAQALLVLQISLQAALDAIIVAFDLDDTDDDIKELQSLIQSIKAAQVEHQHIRFIRYYDCPGSGTNRCHYSSCYSIISST